MPYIVAVTKNLGKTGERNVSLNAKPKYTVE